MTGPCRHRWPHRPRRWSCQLHHVFAATDTVARADVRGMVEDVVVHQGAVGGVEILDHPTAVAVNEAGMDLGNPGIVDHNRAMRRPPDGGLGLKFEDLTSRRGRGEHDESGTNPDVAVEERSGRRRNGWYVRPTGDGHRARCRHNDPVLDTQFEPHRPQHPKEGEVDDRQEPKAQQEEELRKRKNCEPKCFKRRL